VLIYQNWLGTIAPGKASQEDCVMEQKDLEYFRNLLAGMLEEALKHGEMTLEDMTDNNEIFADPADRATMESDRAFTLRIRDRERRLIKKIRAALQRLDDGTFGICDDCGEDIGVPRLKARPVTKLCINCKSKQEEDEHLRGE
jgi:DnaK suppressor protein